MINIRILIRLKLLIINSLSNYSNLFATFCVQFCYVNIKQKAFHLKRKILSDLV